MTHARFARALVVLGLLCAWSPTAKASDRPHVIVVVGAEGTPDYGQQFRTWAERWQNAAKAGQTDCEVIGLDDASAATDRERLQQALAKHSQEPQRPLWLVLIGHGTFDGKTARFNLRGPDFTPADLTEWLERADKGSDQAEPKPVAILNCASSSGPFLAELSGVNRVVISATRSGHEYNFARLGDYLSQAIGDATADLDKDEQTSLLEAYLVAAARVREFYASESRLATEHALLDDNGDKLGTPADWFQGLRPAKAAKEGASLDGTLASQFVLVRSSREEQLSEQQRSQRDALEKQLAELRQRKSSLPEDEYFALLEPILVELARLYAGSSPAAAAP